MNCSVLAAYYEICRLGSDNEGQTSDLSHSLSFSREEWGVGKSECMCVIDLVTKYKI
jgi:hypothetical protein